MTAHLDHAALVRFLEQFRRRLGDAGDEVLTVFLREFGALVHGPSNKVDRTYLRFMVVTQLLVEDEGLQHKTNMGAFHQSEQDDGPAYGCQIRSHTRARRHTHTHTHTTTLVMNSYAIDLKPK